MWKKSPCVLSYTVALTLGKDGRRHLHVLCRDLSGYWRICTKSWGVSRILSTRDGEESTSAKRLRTCKKAFVYNHACRTSRYRSFDVCCKWSPFPAYHSEARFQGRVPNTRHISLALGMNPRLVMYLFLPHVSSKQASLSPDAAMSMERLQNLVFPACSY